MNVASKSSNKKINGIKGYQLFIWDHDLSGFN